MKITDVKIHLIKLDRTRPQRQMFVSVVAHEPLEVLALRIGDFIRPWIMHGKIWHGWR